MPFLERFKWWPSKVAWNTYDLCTGKLIYCLLLRRYADGFSFIILILIEASISIVNDSILLPLHRDLYAWEETRATALKTFEDNKPNMMKVAIQGLEHDLKLAK